MRAVLPGTRGRGERWARAAGYAGALLAVAALAATAGDGLDLGARARLVRYVGILIAAGLAVGAPHLLYPDPHARRLQLSNPSPARLLRRQVGRSAPIFAALSVPAVVIAVGADAGLGQRIMLVTEGVLAMWGLGLYTILRIAGIGERAQAWEARQAGGWYRTLHTWAPPVRFQVPDPLVPGLLLTGEVFLVGAAVAIAGRASGSLGLGAASLLTIGAVGLLLRRAGVFDRAFWTTNGVWADTFRQAGAPVEGRAPLRHDAVYWAPRAVRPAVWAGLVSLDRRLPLGRVVVAGLVLIVAVHAAGATEGVRVAALALWTVGVNAAVALTASDTLVPGALAHRLHGVAGWVLARFLMNVRWVVPLALTLAVLAWLHADIGIRTVAVWTLLYLAVAALSAGLVTLVARTRFRRAVA